MTAYRIAVGMLLTSVLTSVSLHAEPTDAPSTARRPLSGSWGFRKVARAGETAGEWRPATVPGCVHTDLFANGKIGDPFYRLNEKDQQWIEREGWEYQTQLVLDDATSAREHLALVFAGLDTYAEVLVNGVSASRTNNMFRTWRIDAKPLLHRGDNTILVRFRSPIEYVKPAYDRLGYRLPAVNDQAEAMVSMWSRKAPYHFGWDWGPRLVTSGIWRPVTLESWDVARLVDVQITQDRLDTGVATLSLKARVQSARATRIRLRVNRADSESVIIEQDVRAGDTDVTIPLSINKPTLWWPNGLGAQYLYSFETRLEQATTNVLLDRRQTRIGLRTIEVVHTRDNDGKSFTIKVNGAPVFMKGANWIPADSFPSRMTAERYRWLLQSAAATHMNMLRVWGGGIYEDDRFYELCDELGLLVWQDFMFACSMYPGDDAFLENVRREAVENVRRLRNHPSLALWAGNNEIEAAWQGWGWQQKFHLSKAAQDRVWADYKKLFHQILPTVIRQEDPGRFYTRSSPSGNEDDIKSNKLGFGDMHYWGVWHAEEPYEKYADNTSRFMSEYGFQSFPEFSTVSKYTLPGDWDIQSPVMLSHQRHPRGNPLIKTYLARDFRAPKDFKSFLYIQQLLQARIIGFAAESHRRRMGYNWGSLYWQLDDCWPVASWSGIDYFGRWKLLHHAARRFFAPELVSVVAAGDKVQVWATSDRRVPAHARLSIRLLDFSGRDVWHRDQAITLAPNASRAYVTLAKGEILGGANPNGVVLVSELWEGTQRLSRNTFTFLKTKDLSLPKTGLKLDVRASTTGGLEVQVTASQFAAGVYLTGVDGFFEDNGFDLLPGESVVVPFRPERSMTPESAAAATKSIKAISVVDSY